MQCTRAAVDSLPHAPPRALTPAAPPPPRLPLPRAQDILHYGDRLKRYLEDVRTGTDTAVEVVLGELSGVAEAGAKKAAAALRKAEIAAAAVSN